MKTTRAIRWRPRGRGVTVFVVGLGTRSGEPIPRLAHDRTRVGYVRDRSGQLVLSALTAENEEQLRAIAEATGGRYFHAPMGDVPIDEVRRALHSMHTAERASQQISTLRDQSVWFALPALLLLFAELGISVARRAKRPVIVEEAA